MSEVRIRYADRQAERDGGDQRPSWAALAEVYHNEGAPGDEFDIEAEIDRALDQEQRDGMLSLKNGYLALRFPPRGPYGAGVTDRVIQLRTPRQP